MHATRILALDFDGLLVDGLKECLLVSWYGHHGAPIDRFSDEGLAALPEAFVKKFEHHRSFAKHLGHFCMPLQPDAGAFASQAAFDRAYARVPSDEVEQFVSRVNAYRALARQSYRSRWLDYHAFYDGLADWLRSTDLPVCIVTANDAGSVQEILQHAGIQVADQRVHGECRDKRGALQAVADQFGVAREQVCFFDDNVLNARDALQAGFRAHWATWGYHTPEHFDIAAQARLPALQLQDLITFESELTA